MTVDINTVQVISGICTVCAFAVGFYRTSKSSIERHERSRADNRALSSRLDKVEANEEIMLELVKSTVALVEQLKALDYNVQKIDKRLDDTIAKIDERLDHIINK